MRIAYFGSGEFGAPTLAQLAAEHDVRLVVTQPDKPAGRSRAMRPTAVAELAGRLGLPTIKPETVADPDLAHRLDRAGADALVVIAYGHKLTHSVLADHFAINLHASLLPKYRGAAPIQWALIHGEVETGVSVIELAQRMDAGRIFAQQSIAIDPEETAGELHDRLSALGPPVVADVLQGFETGMLTPKQQDEAMATKAPKLSRADGWVSFAQPARLVRARIHGLTPWPGCWASIDGTPLRLARVRDHAEVNLGAAPGTVLPNYWIACASGAIELLEVQSPGGKLMTFEAYRHGKAVRVGAVVMSPTPPASVAELQS